MSFSCKTLKIKLHLTYSKADYISQGSVATHLDVMESLKIT